MNEIGAVILVIIGIVLTNFFVLRFISRERSVTGADAEAFTNQGDDATTTILDNNSLFDGFYAKVYDQLVDRESQRQAEVNVALGFVRKQRVDDLAVVDIGCGTGDTIAIWAKTKGVRKAVGIDQSKAMIEVARRRHANGKAEFVIGDAEQIGVFVPDEFNVATCLYYTVYYMRDRVAFFKNVYMWLQPGSAFVMHVVNRDKFDPMLDSAAPWIGFSAQKYAKERITKSQVAFKEFNYEADFLLNGSQASFQEEFKFPGGRTRKQTHSLKMPTMNELRSEVEGAGFFYKEFIDLTMFGYEYQYLFCFVK